MDYIWTGNREEKNSLVIFKLHIKNKCDTLLLSAVDFFQVFGDGKFICYGPNRTAAGYSRIKRVSVKGVKELVIKVSAYNVENFSCDFQKPFFGAELLCNDKVVYSSEDFIAYKDYSKIQNVPRFSIQRGFVEYYDYTVEKVEKLNTYRVDSPIPLYSAETYCDYKKLNFKPFDKGEFSGFDNVFDLYWEPGAMYQVKNNKFNITEFSKQKLEGFYFTDYSLKAEHTGFIQLDISAKTPATIYAVFDEFLENGKWCFRRLCCNSIIKLEVKKGKTHFLSAEPQSLKYLKLFYTGDVKITPSFVLVENSEKVRIKFYGDKKLTGIFNSALSTFRQNAIDIFMDCPSRERAGWLCDSFFSSKAEKFFMGNNNIEKAFLENFLIADVPEIPKNMLPKCFPAEHFDNYIPNWAMWFMVEIADYFKRTGDFELPNKSKNAVYGLVDFFSKYENELGLIENLESWVFIEWSICNSPEYTAGVNFPSNMLYAYALKECGKLYNDNALTEKGNKIQEQILKLAFNGEFFVDNAVRKDKKILPCADHITETCQYYALFTGLCPDENFKDKMIKVFGPSRTSAYPNIPKSNMFIGNYLRLIWLDEIGEYKKILADTVDYFDTMSSKTGTLWEHNQPMASCNHGFASVIAPILYDCFINDKENHTKCRFKILK